MLSDFKQSVPCDLWSQSELLLWFQSPPLSCISDAAVYTLMGSWQGSDTRVHTQKTWWVFLG